MITANGSSENRLLSLLLTFVSSPFGVNVTAEWGLLNILCRVRPTAGTEHWDGYTHSNFIFNRLLI